MLLLKGCKIYQWVALCCFIFIAFIFTDMEGITDLILGTATSLTDQAFSREMEADADRFAIDALHAHQESPIYLAQALAALRDSHQTEESKSSQKKADKENSTAETSLLKYLSTHPAIDERIENAKRAAHQTH